MSIKNLFFLNLYYLKTKYSSIFSTFFKNILYKYIFIYSYKTILLSLLTKKETFFFSKIIILYIKKINLLNNFHYFFYESINSFFNIKNISIFNNELILLQQFNKDRIKKKIHFLSYFIYTYKKFFFIKRYYLLFILYYLKISVFFFKYIFYLFEDLYFYKVYFLENVFIQHSFHMTTFLYSKVSIKKSNYFDMLDFCHNFLDRSLFTFDIRPFWLCFVKNKGIKYYFYNYQTLIFLWYEISEYWIKILETDFKYYGIYRKILMDYKISVPFFNGRKVTPFKWSIPEERGKLKIRWSHDEGKFY